jgi:hypothetical protein
MISRSVITSGLPSSVSTPRKTLTSPKFKSGCVASRSTSGPLKRGRIPRLPDSFPPCPALEVQQKEICIRHASQAQQ